MQLKEFMLHYSLLKRNIIINFYDIACVDDLCDLGVMSIEHASNILCSHHNYFSLKAQLLLFYPLQQLSHLRCLVPIP